MEANFTGAFTRAFEAGENAGQSFLTSIKAGVKSLAVSIASQLIFRMAVVPTVNAGASALGFAGNFLAAPNTAIGGGGFGSFFGGSGGAATAGASAAGAAQTITVNGMNYTAAGSTAGQQAGLFGLGRSTGLGGAFTGGISNTGFSGVDGFLNTQLYNAPTFGSGATASGFYPGTAMAGEAGAFAGGGGGGVGVNVGGAIGGAAGIAGGAYGIYSGIQKGGIGGGFQVAGGAVSAAMGAAQLVGMSLGPPGWIAAAVLAIIGALLPGQKPSGMGQESRIDLYTGDQKYRGLGGKRYSQGNRDMAENVVESLASLSAQLGEKLGGAKIGGDVAVGVTNDKLYLEVNGQKGQFNNDEAGNKALVAAATKMIIQAFYDQGSAKGVYRQIIERTGTDSLEKLGENLQWYETVYKGFDTTEVAATAFTKQMDALKESFQGNIDKAHSFGLSSAAMEAARDKQVAELNAARGFAMMDTLYSLQVPGSLALGQGDVGHTASVAQADARAGQQLKALKDQLTELGLSAEATADWVSYLTNVQAAQRAEAERQRITGANSVLNNLQGSVFQARGDGASLRTISDRIVAAQEVEGVRALREQLVALGQSSDVVAFSVGLLTEARGLQRVEAERQRTFSLNDGLYGLQARGTAAFGDESGAAAIAAAMAANRAANEIEALRQQLVSLGVSSADAASWVQYLGRVQAAEAANAATALAKQAAQNQVAAGGMAEGLTARWFRAAGDNQSADLIAFDTAAAREMVAAREQLEALGMSAGYVAQELARNERVLADERLGIQKRYADASVAAEKAAADLAARATQAGAGSALGVVTSLREYSARLSTTDAGAGTALDRVSAAQRQFDAVFGAASAGNAGSISGLQGAAEAYRLASREVFGGGQGYADAVRMIAERIDSIGGMGADALTQSFVTENARENTDRIVDALASLRTENAALRRDLNLLLMRPAA